MPEVEAEEEAPATLLDLTIGDADVDLYWQGYWKITAAWGTGWEFSDDLVKYPVTYPGLQNGFNLEQEPDFLLSLYLMDRYYVEANFVEDYEQNTYAAGYQGQEGEVVQKVRIGNSEIGIGEYRGIDIPVPKYNTPGAMAAFQSKKSYHEILVRYDPTEEQSRKYLGQYEIDEESVSAADYVSGLVFILPNTSITNVVVYKEQSSGSLTGSDGKRYRRLESGEYSIDNTNGILRLAEESASNILVYYRSGGADIGDVSVDCIVEPDGRYRPDIAQPLMPFSWTDDDPYDFSGGTFADTSQISIGGNTALLLYSPGIFSPFQICNTYAVDSYLPEQNWRIQIELVDRGDPYADAEETFLFNTDRDRKLVSIYSSSADSRSAEYRYPLAETEAGIYGPGRNSEDETVSREMRITVKNDGGGYLLGPNVVPGSVLVKVNGVEDTTAEVDYSTGEIRFRRYIYPDDRITVSYRTESPDLSGGDFLFVQGNHFDLADRLSMDLAGAIRWNMDPDGMTEEPGESPGEFLITAGGAYDGDNLDVDLFTAVDFTTPDTAGRLRLAGMENASFYLPCYDDVIVPAVQRDYNASIFSELIYQDFTSRDAGNLTVLNAYSWSGAEDDLDEDGPSPAASRSSDPFSGAVMVLKYDLLTGESTAGDLLVSENGPIDASGFSGLQFYVRTDDTVGDINFLLETGETGERTDLDDNGGIDGRNTSLLISDDLTASLPSADDQWQLVEWLWTDDERQRLSRCRSIRLIIDADADSSGRIIAGGFRLLGSPVKIDVYDTSGQPVIDDADLEINAREVSDSSLEDRFDEVDDVFHYGGGSQRALRIDWTGLDASDRLEAVRFVTPVRITDYRTLVLYVRHEQTGGTHTVEFLDADDKGVTAEYQVSETGWQKLSIDLDKESGSLSHGGTVLDVDVDRSADELTRFSYSVEDLDSGTVYMDEFHMTDPLFSFSNSTELSASYVYPEVFWQSAEGFPFAGNAFADTTLHFSGGKVLTPSDSGSVAFESRFNGGVDFMLFRLEGRFQGAWAEGTENLGGGHTVRFPANWQWGYISDSYNRSYGEDTTMSRENIFNFSVPDTGSLTFSASAVGEDDTLDQQWNAMTDWIISPLFNVNANSTFNQQSIWQEQTRDQYGSDWAYDYRLISPADYDNDRRETNHSISLNLDTALIDSVNTFSTGYSTALAPEAAQTNILSADLSLPVTFNDSSGKTLFIFTPSYSRRSSQTYNDETGENFPEDFGVLGRSYQEAMPLTNFLPYYELFSEEPLDRFMDITENQSSSQYIPEAGFAVSRIPGSHWSDLFVPSVVSADFRRQYEKQADTYFYETVWDFTCKFTALNLFGRFGLFPLIPLYNSDHFSQTFRWTFESTNDAVPESDTFSWQLFFFFEGERNNNLTLDNTLTYAFHDYYMLDEARIAFIWRTRGKDQLRIPLVKTPLRLQNYLQNEESVTMSVQSNLDGADEDAAETFLVTVRHDTKLMIDSFGSLGFYFFIGSGLVQDVRRVGMELGLELLLSF